MLQTSLTERRAAGGDRPRSGGSRLLNLELDGSLELGDWESGACSLRPACKAAFPQVVGVDGGEFRAEFCDGLNFLHGPSSNRRDCQKDRFKFGPITSSFDVSIRTSGPRSSANPCRQPCSEGPASYRTAKTFQTRGQFSS